MNLVRRFLCSSFLWILLAPYIVTGLGAASNQAVLIANHDKFPVMVNAVKLDEYTGEPKIDIVTVLTGTPSVETEKPKPTDATYIDDVHIVMTSDTHLNALADIFDFHSAIYSIGDGLLMLGEWLSGFCPMVFLALVFKKCWDADAI